nr:uncharacterized protein CTRU02_02473 [Colletotrichum truncatum]KAF6798499.1 hypothetical protein CTRU02_02473 [Colletotrichum truncatum]
MSFLRLVLIRSPILPARILPIPQPCTLRPQLLQKSLPQHSLRRSFASAPGGTKGPGAAVSKSAASGPAAGSGTSPARSTQQLLPEKLLIYHAGRGKIGFVAGLKITTIFVAAVFVLVMEPAMYRNEMSAAQIAMASGCAVTPLLYVAYFSAPFVTHVFLRLPPYARQSRALLERYVRALPPAAQLEVGTLGLAARPRATLVSAGDLRPLPKDAGFLKSRGNLVTHTRDVSDLMARKKWYHYRPVSQFMLQTGAGSHGKSGFKNTAKDSWVYDIIHPLLGKRKQ